MLQLCFRCEINISMWRKYSWSYLKLKFFQHFSWLFKEAINDKTSFKWKYSNDLWWDKERQKLLSKIWNTPSKYRQNTEIKVVNSLMSRAFTYKINTYLDKKCQNFNYSKILALFYFSFWFVFHSKLFNLYFILRKKVALLDLQT
jgi:hypothetical protein